VPLVALAYGAVAAGLLMGAGGAVFSAVVVAAAVVAGALVRRSVVPGALAALLAAGAMLGQQTAAADARCAAQIEADGAATVRLREEAGRSASARGYAIGPGCRVPIRLRVIRGTAPAGATVRALGSARRQGTSITIADARIRLLAPPGVLARLRTRTGAVIDALYGEQAPLARALLIADERDISPEVRRKFADAGIIHMLSVSGLHVAVLAEAIVLVAMLAGVSTRRAELVAVLTITVFVAFVGAPSPAVRSAAMYAALVASRRLQRPTSPWALLALGAAVPLFEPRVSGEIGYHLSVVGMAALVAAGRLSRRLPMNGLPPWARRVTRETVATLVASLATAPIVAWHFGRVSLAAPVTNLAAAPLFGLAQPALFLSLAVAPIRPLAQLIADGTGLLLGGIDRVGEVGAAIPWSALDVIPSAMTAWLVAGSVGALLAACASRYWARPLVLALSGAAAALWWPVVRPAGDALELHVIDVGQGDAIALRTPRWRWILVDAGDAWRTSDAGERVVAPYLRRRGGDVAVMVMSHPHADHIGGAAAVLRLLPVAAVWDGGFLQASEVYQGVLAAARERGVAWHPVRRGRTTVVDGVRLSVLAPDSLTAARAPDANAASVVIMAEYRQTRVLLTGDLEREGEADLVRHLGDSLRADILKVGHHGSATSTSEPFLDAVAPRLALVSVGAGNRYGHPNAGVMERFRNRKTPVLRTDDEGTVVATIGGGWIRVTTDEGRWLIRAAGQR